MPAIHDANLELVLSGSDDKVRKRWRVAFTAVYCSRAFLPPPSSRFVIDHSVLTYVVKEKSLDKLAQLGGVDGVCASLKTDQQSGINGDDEDIASRYEAFGGNTYPNLPAKSFIHFVFQEVKDPSILIQVLFALLSFAIGSNAEGVSLIVASLLVMFVSIVTNFRQSRQFEKLSNVSEGIKVDVVRKGRRLQGMSIFEIVVGDVVCLSIGDQVPADGLFIDGHSLQIDESSLTGESDHVRVDRDDHPFLLSGTTVADGYAKMVVTSVGMRTFWGEIMSATSRDPNNEETPLQSQLKRLTSYLCLIGLMFGLVVLVVLLVRYFRGNREIEGEKMSVFDALVGIISTCMTIVVVAIPEGLPVSVTLSQTYSIKQMMLDKVMVRRLSACETMGSATTICTDKTGTLTLNETKVTSFWQGKELRMRSCSLIGRNVIELLCQGIGLNTTGSVCTVGGRLEVSGSSTEKAILSWGVQELGMETEEVQRGCNIVRVEAFNSERKRSGILMKKVEDGSLHVHWKGAVEMILTMCTHYYDLEGNMVAMDDNERMEINLLIQGAAASSLRCIAFAHKLVSDQAKIEEDGLSLLGFVGLKDPCRPGVKKAVEDCRRAGVDVKMITGDNVFTAKAIATECGILLHDDVSDESVVEGLVFRNYTEEEQMEKVDRIRVMARSSPSDKLLMVECLKKKEGLIVAVIGDGTNDAMALKEADVGLAMGDQGTEVAKGSSDIVILDDNFASVATVLQWGRCVHNNIQKFIQFQLTVNVGALMINVIAAISGVETPLTIIQLLWANLIMDTLGALALATENPCEELMEKKAAGRSEPLISNVMWRNLTAQAMYQTAVLLTLQFRGEAILGVAKNVNDTLIFNVFIICQIFNEFNARMMEKKNVFEGILKNKLFLGIIGITVVLQVVMVEFLNKYADTKRLNLSEWGMCVGIAAASWPIALLVKFIPVPDRPFLSYVHLGRHDFEIIKLHSF